MRIVNCQDTAFYRPRQPWDSPLYRLIEEHYEEFERVYPDRFQARYGFWRPVIRTAVLDYLKCGDPREGFARVRCPDCRHEFFVAFSCKQRCICPSCHQKRTLVIRSTLPKISVRRFRTGSLSLLCRNGSGCIFALTGNCYASCPGWRGRRSWTFAGLCWGAMMSRPAWSRLSRRTGNFG